MVKSVALVKGLFCNVFLYARMLFSTVKSYVVDIFSQNNFLSEGMQKKYKINEIILMYYRHLHFSWLLIVSLPLAIYHFKKI